MQFKKNTESLAEHARSSGHTIIQCNYEGCGKGFNRQDTFLRHMAIHKTVSQIRFPCNLCKKYRGKQGFKRRDHLIQHLRNLHTVNDKDLSSRSSRSRVQGFSCPHEECSEYRGELDTEIDPKLHAFDKLSKLTQHLKKVHDESKFPCSVIGCDRVGGKGYMREKDLTKHMEKEHPNMGDY